MRVNLKITVGLLISLCVALPAQADQTSFRGISINQPLEEAKANIPDGFVMRYSEQWRPRIGARPRYEILNTSFVCAAAFVDEQMIINELGVWPCYFDLPLTIDIGEFAQLVTDNYGLAGMDVNSAGTGYVGQSEYNERFAIEPSDAVGPILVVTPALKGAF